MRSLSGRPHRLPIRTEEGDYRYVSKGFIRFVEDPRVNGYVGRVEAEKVLHDLDEFRRRYLGVVGKSAELFYRDVRDLILKVC